MHQTFLKDDILLLRAVNPEDADIMWEVETDSTQWIQNCMAAPMSRTMLMEYALSYSADPFREGQLRLIIERRVDNETLGIVDLYEISAIHRRAFIGIYVIPKFRQMGFGEKTLKLIEKFAFSILNLNQLGAKIVIDNKESINLFKKLNFSECGCMPDWIQTGNKWSDLLLFSKRINKYNND